MSLFTLDKTSMQNNLSYIYIYKYKKKKNTRLQLKAYKYRLYPSKSQEIQLNQNFGSVRFVWNKLVANFNSWTPDYTPENLNEKILKSNPEFSWLNESISYALQQKRIDFENTKKQFFNRDRKKKLGRMKFKKKGVSHESFRIPGQALGYITCVDFEKSRLRLPKIGKVKIVVDRKFYGSLKSITISKNKTNQFYASILVEEDVYWKPDTSKSVGIDLGINHLMILSDGTKVDNPRWFRESQAKLKKAQQHLARKTKGSKRYQEQKLKIAKVHQKTANQREWFLHNVTTKLVNEFDHIFLEDLNVDGMKRNHCLAKSISDASFAAVRRMLSYKSDWYGRSFHCINRFYPSSKTCSSCGHKIDTMTLDVHEWICPSCGTLHDRDINAAKNIESKGLQDLYNLSSDELADYRRREVVRPIAYSE
jgi:putative transposase